MELDIEAIFSHHPPKSEETVLKHEWVREQLKEIAYNLKENLPQSPETTLAIRKLQEVMMYANAAIAIHG